MKVTRDVKCESAEHPFLAKTLKLYTFVRETKRKVKNTNSPLITSRTSTIIILQYGRSSSPTNTNLFLESDPILQVLFFVAREVRGCFQCQEQLECGLEGDVMMRIVRGKKVREKE